MADKKHIQKSVYNQCKGNFDFISKVDTPLKELARQRVLSAAANQKLDISFKDYEHSFKTVLETRRHVQALCDVPFTSAIYHVEKKFDQFLYRYVSNKIFCELQQAFNINRDEVKRSLGSITQELRKCKLQLKKKFSKTLLEKVRALVKELHAIILIYHKAQRKFLRRLRKIFMPVIRRDIRSTHRHTVPLIFKYLPDFSGCEEEAGFNTSVSLKQLFLINKGKTNELQQTIFSKRYRFVNSVGSS